MTIDEIFDEWQKDALDLQKEYNLAAESLKTPLLHHKYYRLLSQERMKAIKIDADLKELKRIKSEYYMGTLDTETMKARGYRPFKIRVLKTDLSTYVDSDQELINMNIKLSIINEKVDVLKAIIGMINSRSFHINGAIEMIKFRSGTN